MTKNYKAIFRPSIDISTARLEDLSLFWSMNRFICFSYLFIFFLDTYDTKIIFCYNNTFLLIQRHLTHPWHINITRRFRPNYIVFTRRHRYPCSGHPPFVTWFERSKNLSESNKRWITISKQSKQKKSSPFFSGIIDNIFPIFFTTTWTIGVVFGILPLLFRVRHLC